MCEKIIRPSLTREKICADNSDRWISLKQSQTTLRSHPCLLAFHCLSLLRIFREIKTEIDATLSECVDIQQQTQFSQTRIKGKSFRLINILKDPWEKSKDAWITLFFYGASTLQALFIKSTRIICSHYLGVVVSHSFMTLYCSGLQMEGFSPRPKPWHLFIIDKLSVNAMHGVKQVLAHGR